METTTLILLLLVLIAWETVWKIIALWKAARNNHLVWFICIAVFNTVGILPIIYIYFFQTKSKTIKEVKETVKAVKKKK